MTVAFTVAFTVAAAAAVKVDRQLSSVMSCSWQDEGDQLLSLYQLQAVSSPLST